MITTAAFWIGWVFGMVFMLFIGWCANQYIEAKEKRRSQPSGPAIGSEVGEYGD